jgi:hypothetical protein
MDCVQVESVDIGKIRDDIVPKGEVANYAIKKHLHRSYLELALELFDACIKATPRARENKAGADSSIDRVDKGQVVLNGADVDAGMKRIAVLASHQCCLDNIPQKEIQGYSRRW